MFSAQTQFAFSGFVLLFMHQIGMLESAPTTANIDFDITSSNNRAVSILPKSKLWKDAIIAYEMEASIEPHRCLIESAMMHIMLQSCVLFRPMKDPRQQSLFIVKDDSHRCAATLGAPESGWMSKMSLSAERCYNIGTILHELMHVLGFKHEQQRSDRDQYLQINYENIKNHRNFKKNNRSKETNFTQFDFDSITIYGPVHSSKDRKRLKTIESKVDGNEVGPSKYKLSLSPLDVKSINELYKCHLVDNKACEKVVLLNDYIANCSVEASKYINLSWIKKLIHQCE